MNKIKTSALTLILVIGFVITAIQITIPRTQAASPVSDSTFSIMQISDTQHLAFLNPTLYNDLTSWIVNNSAMYNLQMVVHTGDFVDAFGGPPIVAYNASQIAQEWAVANASMSNLLNAGIPYCWDAGNHDQTPWANSNGTMIGNSYLAFNATYMRSKSYWVSSIFDSKNTAVKFTYNNYPFMIINLEYTANSSAIAWMKGLLDNSTGVNVIIATHCYLNEKAGYGSANPLVNEVGWAQALKATLNSYPNVFLTLSGHIHTVNTTRVGNRQEVLFGLSGATSNGTGAAHVRIYTFNLTSKQVNTSTYCLDAQTWLTDAYNQFSFDASLTSDWTLTQAARAMKAYPDLREYIWQKDARMQPNGQYDKIGLHRLVKTGITPKGVIFLTNCPMWGTGEARISNPTNDTWTKYENFSQAIYWANRGFDVYAIDYRTHFIPASLNSSQRSFMADWGFDVWISDMKEAANKVKEVSGSSKFFIAGECTGGVAALNYATKYWKDDLRGIILLDPQFFNLGYPIVATLGTETNTYNLTQTINSMKTSGTYAYTPTLTLTPTLAAYALQNPGAPAEYPPGTPLTPTINPATSKTWTNITEYVTYNVTYNVAAYRGMYANLMGGYGNVTQFEYFVVNRDSVPNRLIFEMAAMIDWVNCPYLTYDWNDHYKEIDVPVLAFAAGLFLNRTGTFRFVNGINNTDFTTVMLKDYGHTDVYYGTYSARDVSEPAYQWMVNHYPPLTASASPTSVTVETGLSVTFTVKASGTVAPYTYQWYQGTNMLKGQTSPSLFLATNKDNEGGEYPYYCKVTDAEGKTLDSNQVWLKVAAPETSTTTQTTPATTPTPEPSPTPTPEPTPPAPNPTVTSDNNALVLPTEVYAVAIVIVFILAVSVALVFRRRKK